MVDMAVTVSVTFVTMTPDELLKDWREANNIGVLAAATAVDVERQTWWRWETGASKVSIDKLDKVVATTGIPRAQLRPDLAAMFAGPEAA